MSRPQVPSDLLGPSLLMVSSSLSAFGQFLPHITEVRSHTPMDAAYTSDVRMGELAAGTFMVAFGAIATSLTGSMVPLVVSCIMAAGLVGLYETALNSGVNNA